MSRTHRAEIGLKQCRLAEEAVIQRRHVAAHDEGHDSRVIQLVAPAGDLGAVIHDGVKGRAHAQAQDGAAKEARKDGNVGGASRVVPRMDHAVEICGDDDGNKSAKEVRPDVDKLVVQVEEGAGRVGVGAADLAVAGMNKGIVAAPGGEVIPELEERVFDLVLYGLGGADGGGAKGWPALPDT